MIRKLAIVVAVSLAGCATHAPEPKIVTKVVQVPVPVMCPDKRLPPQPLPDTAEAIAALPLGDIDGLVKLILAGRVVRDQRLSEDEGQIQACSAAAAKP